MTLASIPELPIQKEKDSLEEALKQPSLSERLAHSEIGNALLKHFEKYGDIYIRPKEL